MAMIILLYVGGNNILNKSSTVRKELFQKVEWDKQLIPQFAS